MIRDAWGTPTNHTLAASAHWEYCRLDPSRPDLQQAWVLRSVVTEDDTGQNPDARKLDVAIRPTGLSPDQIDLILSKKAVDYLSSARVMNWPGQARTSTSPCSTRSCICTSRSP